MKRLVRLFTVLMVLLSPLACSKGNETDNGGKEQQNTESQDPDTSKDPVSSTDPEESTDPDPSEEPREYTVPEMLVISPVMLEYVQDEDGIWKAEASFQIDTDAEDIYAVYSPEDSFDESVTPEAIMKKYRPLECSDNGYGGKILTLEDKLAVFGDYKIMVVGANGDKYLSKVSTFETNKPSEFESTLFVEADVVSANAYNGGFTLALYKDAKALKDGTGGYSVSVEVEVGDNFKNGKYTIPDGKYSVSAEKMSFRTVIPGVGDYYACVPATLEVKSNSLAGTWEIAILFDTRFNDWNEFKRVSSVAFTLSGKSIDVRQSDLTTVARMTGNVNFDADNSSASVSIISRRYLSRDYKVLVYSANATDYGKWGEYDTMSVALVIPDDFDPGTSSWSDLNGKYTVPDNDSWRKAGNVDILPFSTIVRAPAQGYTYFVRYDALPSGMYDLFPTEFAMPGPGSQPVEVSASSDGSWVQLKVDMKDYASSYKVTCSTIFMTEDVKTAE